MQAPGRIGRNAHDASALSAGNSSSPASPGQLKHASNQRPACRNSAVALAVTSFFTAPSHTLVSRHATVSLRHATFSRGELSHHATVSLHPGIPRERKSWSFRARPSSARTLSSGPFLVPGSRDRLSTCGSPPASRGIRVQAGIARFRVYRLARKSRRTLAGRPGALPQAWLYPVPIRALPPHRNLSETSISNRYNSPRLGSLKTVAIAPAALTRREALTRSPARQPGAGSSYAATGSTVRDASHSLRSRPR